MKWRAKMGRLHAAVFLEEKTGLLEVSFGSTAGFPRV